MNKFNNVYLSELKCLYPLKKLFLALLWIVDVCLLAMLVVAGIKQGTFLELPSKGSFLISFLILMLLMILVLYSKRIWKYIRLKFHTIPLLTEYFDNKELIKSIDEDEYKLIHKLKSASALYQKKYYTYNGDKWLIVCDHYLYKDLIAGTVLVKTFERYWHKHVTYSRGYELWVIYYTGDLCRIKLAWRLPEDVMSLLDKIAAQNNFNICYEDLPMIKKYREHASKIHKITGLSMNETDLSNVHIDEKAKKDIKTYFDTVIKKNKSQRAR